MKRPSTSKLTKSSFALLELGKRYRTRSGDVWEVFRQMGGLFAARRSRDDIVEYFYPSGWASHPAHRGRGIRLSIQEPDDTAQSAVLQSVAVLRSETVLQEPPESGTVRVGAEPSTAVHVTIDEGLGA